MKNKLFLVVLTILMVASLLVACSPGGGAAKTGKSKNQADGGSLTIHDGEYYSDSDSKSKVYSSEDDSSSNITIQDDQNSIPVEEINFVIIDNVKYIECDDFYYATKANDEITGVITIKGIVESKPVKVKSFGFESTAITKVIFDKDVQEIEELAFLNCSNLLSFEVDINNPVYSTKDGIIYSKDGSTIVQYPTGSKISTVYIGENITEIKPGALELSNLAELSTSTTNTSFFTQNGVLFNSTLTELIRYPAKKADNGYSIPNTVSKIWEGAFNSCRNLKNIFIPQNVNDIGAAAFASCSELLSVNIPSNITEIKNNTFANCSKLANTTIPQTVQAIGDAAFELCTQFTKVDLINNTSLTSIGKYAFYGCTNLVEITLPFVGNNNTSNNYLGYIFGADNPDLNINRIPPKLTTVKIGATASKIGTGAFKDCTSVTSITVNSGANIQSIGQEAFKNCVKLSQFVVPNSVQEIKANAFENCRALNTLTLGSGLQNIKANAFMYTTAITDVIVNSLPDYLKISYENFMSHPLWNNSGDVKINGQVINEINIPQSSSISEIKPYAFLNLSSLTKVTIPNTITSIAKHAFSGCTGLKNIQLPNNLQNIGEEAFSKSGLTSIHIPSTINSISKGAFKYCTELTIVTFEAPTTRAVATIGNEAFYNCSKLSTIELPNSITGIGANAFNSCRSLKEINIPENCTSIGVGAFSMCNKLTTVIIDSPTIAANVTASSSYGELCSTLRIEKVYVKMNISNIGSYLTNTELFGYIDPANSGKENYKEYVKR